MRILSDQPIRRQVVAITGALLVPFIVAAGWSANRSRVEHADELREQAASVAATAGAYLNTYLAGLDSMASALTRHPAVMALDKRQCTPLFEAVLRDQPLMLNIVVVDTNGEYQGTAVPTKLTRVPPEGIAFVNDVIRTGRPQVTNLITSPISGQPTVVLSYPVRNPDGALVGVLGLSLNVTRLQTVFSDIPLPEGSVVTMFDGASRVIARSRDAELYIGKAASSNPPLTNNSRASRSQSLHQLHVLSGRERKLLASASPTNSCFTGSKVSLRFSIHDIAAARRRVRQ